MSDFIRSSEQKDKGRVGDLFEGTTTIQKESSARSFAVNSSDFTLQPGSTTTIRLAPAEGSIELSGIQRVHDLTQALTVLERYDRLKPLLRTIDLNALFNDALQGPDGVAVARDAPALPQQRTGEETGRVALEQRTEGLADKDDLDNTAAALAALKAERLRRTNLRNAQQVRGSPVIIENPGKGPAGPIQARPEGTDIDKKDEKLPEKDNYRADEHMHEKDHPEKSPSRLTVQKVNMQVRPSVIVEPNVERQVQSYREAGNASRRLDNKEALSVEDNKKESHHERPAEKASRAPQLGIIQTPAPRTAVDYLGRRSFKYFSIKQDGKENPKHYGSTTLYDLGVCHTEWCTIQICELGADCDWRHAPPNLEESTWIMTRGETGRIFLSSVSRNFKTKYPGGVPPTSQLSPLPKPTRRHFDKQQLPSVANCEPSDLLPICVKWDTLWGKQVQIEEARDAKKVTLSQGILPHQIRQKAREDTNVQTDFEKDLKKPIGESEKAQNTATDRLPPTNVERPQAVSLPHGPNNTYAGDTGQKESGEGEKDKETSDVHKAPLLQKASQSKDEDTDKVTSGMSKEGPEHTSRADLEQLQTHFHSTAYDKNNDILAWISRSN